MNFFNTVFPGAPKGVAIKRLPPDGLEGQRLSLEGMSGHLSRQVRERSAAGKCGMRPAAA